VRKRKKKSGKEGEFFFKRRGRGTMKEREKKSEKEGEF
jgi:hypothetical protein